MHSEPVRDLLDHYLGKRMSRQRFIGSMLSWGFSFAAATSIAQSLDAPDPAFDASSPSAAKAGGRTSPPGGLKTGGALLVAQLRAAGFRYLFNCTSSDTYPVFDALLDDPGIQVIQALCEGQLISMAHGYSLASGQPAFTLGDSAGFPNMLTNMYNAWMDRSPLVVGSQRAAKADQGGVGEAQEWDDFLGPASNFTRWRWSVAETSRIPELTRRALRIATATPGGPVALAFPTDVLADTGSGEIIEGERFLGKAAITADPKQIEAAAKLLLEAERPLLMLGPEVTRSGGAQAVIRLAESLAIPVVQGEWLFDDFPTNHPLFVGSMEKFPGGLGEADLLVNLGSKMPRACSRMTGGTQVVHVSTDPAIISTIVPTEIGIVADSGLAANDLVEALHASATQARMAKIRDARLPEVRAHTALLRAELAKATETRWNDSPMSWERVGAELNRLLDRDAIIVQEISGSDWLDLATFQFDFAPGQKSKIGRTTGLSLGWGVGAAVGVKLAQPDRQVVALQGDGGFLFSQAESLWTMARYEIPVITVVFNNRSHNGPRRQILERSSAQRLAEREMTCYLGDPDVDFVQLAAGFGVKGETVADPADLAGAIERAVRISREGRPYLLNALVRRTGLGAESKWHPPFSLAKARSRKV